MGDETAGCTSVVAVRVSPVTAKASCEAPNCVNFCLEWHDVLVDMYLYTTGRCCMQALEGAKSLEEVTTAHSRFVDAVQRQCLLAPDKTWKLIEGVVVQILNQVLQFAVLQQKLRKPVSL